MVRLPPGSGMTTPPQPGQPGHPDQPQSAAPADEPGQTAPVPDPPAAQPDPMAMLRSKSYVQLLVLAAIIGVPVSAVAYGFLKLVSLLQQWFFVSLPKEVGFSGTPVWWPLPLLAVSGVLVGCHHPVPAGHRGPHPGRGVQDRWRGPHRGGAPRSGDRRAGHPEPRCGPRTGGSAHRHRRRPGAPVGQPGQARCATRRGRRDGLGRQLRRHQHPVRIPHPRRLPADGSGRYRRTAPRAGPPTRALGRRRSAPSSSSV